MKTRRILIVDQNVARRNYAGDVLRHCGHEVLCKAKLDLTDDLLGKPVIEIFILNDRLSPNDIKHLKALNPNINIIIFSDDPMKGGLTTIPEQFTSSQLIDVVKREGNNLDWQERPASCLATAL